MSNWEGYRQSKLGDCLVETLDSLISQDKITPELALRVLEEFDSCVLKHLRSLAIKVQIRGDLHTYRSYDDVYNLIVQNAIVTFLKDSERFELKTDALKIVCQDARLGMNEEDVKKYVCTTFLLRTLLTSYFHCRQE